MICIVLKVTFTQLNDIKDLRKGILLTMSLAYSIHPSPFVFGPAYCIFTDEKHKSITIQDLYRTNHGLPCHIQMLALSSTQYQPPSLISNRFFATSLWRSPLMTSSTTTAAMISAASASNAESSTIPDEKAGPLYHDKLWRKLSQALLHTFLFLWWSHSDNWEKWDNNLDNPNFDDRISVCNIVLHNFQKWHKYPPSIFTNIFL